MNAIAWAAVATSGWIVGLVMGLVLGWSLSSNAFGDLFEQEPQSGFHRQQFEPIQPISPMLNKLMLTQPGKYDPCAK